MRPAPASVARLARTAPSFGLTALFALTPSASFAQDARAAQQLVNWRDGLRLTFAVEGTPEVDYGDANVSWVRTTGRVSLQGPVSDRWGMGVSLMAELLSSDADADPPFLAVAADPSEGALRDLFESSLTIGVRRRFGERFALGADGYLTAKLEPGAELNDSLKGGSAFTLGYERSDTFNLTAGFQLGSRFDRSGVYAWPVLRLAWQATPRLELEIRGANLRLTYAMWDRVDLLVFGGAHADRYRLERRTLGPLADDAGTIGVRGATLGFGFLWRANEHFRVIGTAGVAVWQRLLVNDASADRVASRDMEGAAPVIALRVQTRF